MRVTFKKSLKMVLLVGLLVSGLVVVKANARAKDYENLILDRIGDRVAELVGDRLANRTVIRKFSKIYYDSGLYGRTW